MAINKNHLFEELDGIKCGIVEKEVAAERVAFLKKILEYNGFTVISVPSPAPKAPVHPVVKKRRWGAASCAGRRTETSGNLYCWGN